MSACVALPENLEDGSLLYVAYVILTPVAFSLGLLANLLNLFVLNSNHIRRYNAAFTYLAALSLADLLYLVCITPQYLRHSQVLEPEVTYSETMTSLTGACRLLRAILLHVALWCTALATVVCLLRVRTYDVTGCTRISISRFVVFLFCVASTILNLPRIFQYSVQPITGHCFEGEELWDLHTTDFGDTILYRTLYQWIVIAVALVTPFVVILVASCVLPCRIGIRRFCLSNQCLPSAGSDKDRELQLAKCTVILASVSLVTCVPHAVVSVLTVLFEDPTFSTTFDLQTLTHISEMLLLFRTVAPGFIYFFAYGDYHKAICRTLFCSADEYYEPCACVYLACARAKELPLDCDVLDYARAKENAALAANIRSTNSFLNSKKKPKKEFSRWV